MAKHPQVTLDLTLSDRVVDLVDEGYDVAVRIASLPSSSLISRKLSASRMVLCASPVYLRKHGKPKQPSDLAEHTVLAYSLPAMGETWAFEGPLGQVSVKVQPSMRTNSGDTCRAVALAHHGTVFQPIFLVDVDLLSGALVEVLPDYRSVVLGIYAMYPTPKHVSPKVRVLIEYLVDAFKKPSWPA